jgi:LDH2 family malate/lactate/ureidoglycolate dehydrogenase
MNIAIEKARQVGSGWVSVQNSNHFGIAGHHAMMALPHDMIGIAMTNASALVSPTFSKERMLGTNPIAVAVPAGEQPPFVADFATTTAANGKLEILQRKNMAVPSGWAQDEHGNETNDAQALKKGGALLPLGGDREHSSHKGFMLGSIVDIFSGVLSGANFGPWVPPFPAYVPMPENMVKTYQWESQANLNKLKAAIGEWNPLSVDDWLEENFETLYNKIQKEIL